MSIVGPAVFSHSAFQNYSFTPHAKIYWRVREKVRIMKFNPQQVGVYTGLFLAVLHALWALLVFLGFAGTLMNFVFGLHFLSNPYVVMPFSIGNALMLVFFVFIVGYVLGYVGTIYWNKMQKGR